MSSLAEVIVLGRDAEQLMHHLTVRDDEREWHQCFTPVGDAMFEGTNRATDECYAWVIQDSCFGLWMIYDGKLCEVQLPRTQRLEFRSSVTGVLLRTDHED
ncbi:hypothetical protein ACFXG4_50295 [Nocardia sp. NPDC059246]|uniref:hypothetical protein n=1 Tax=unclassified Nocardia TaxID=2637762 RepID=UPI0036C10D54